VFKTMNCWENVNESDFFRRDESWRMGHTCNYFKIRYDWILNKFSFVCGYAISGTTSRATRCCTIIDCMLKYFKGQARFHCIGIKIHV